MEQREEAIVECKETIKDCEKDIRNLRFKLNHTEESLQGYINNANDRQEEIDNMMDNIAAQNDRLEDYALHYPDLTTIKNNKHAITEFDLWMSEA